MDVIRLGKRISCKIVGEKTKGMKHLRSLVVDGRTN